ncbi:hypothetical protein GLE_3672 [Lysobacter enzymogenes]|uniref:Uncharacterized protein n=1 Tax=Lysobacter enzymogenes TaxID=69 RepID=A0A0S2DLC8_LYSEN|nr:hypothetical protein GLE_3672 [Lysobacter enzymogenes]
MIPGCLLFAHCLALIAERGESSKATQYRLCCDARIAVNAIQMPLHGYERDANASCG